MDMYIVGEELFALRTSKYPEMARTRKEVGLDQLYGLYLDVLQSVEVNQSDAVDRRARPLARDDRRGQSIRPALQKDAEAPPRVEGLEDLRAKLTDFQDLLPLISELAKPSVKPKTLEGLFLFARRLYAAIRQGGLSVARHLRESQY